MEPVDDLAAARGCCMGLLLALPLWALIIWAGLVIRRWLGAGS